MSEINNDNISSLWFKVKLANRKYIAIGGYYRQWRLLAECNQPLSGSYNCQLERLKLFIKHSERAISESNMTLILGDINIDR